MCMRNKLNFHNFYIFKVSVKFKISLCENIVIRSKNMIVDALIVKKTMS